jgi:tetratricopeptide (TPR) repeat protein
MSTAKHLIAVPSQLLALALGVNLSVEAFNISPNFIGWPDSSEIKERFTFSQSPLQDKSATLLCQFVARDEGKAKKLCESGEEEIKRGNLDKATAFYTEANLFNPTSGQVMLGLARIADRRGDLDEAIKKARAAAQFDQDSVNTHMVLGGYLERNQEFIAAALQYERAIDLTKVKDEQIPLCNKVTSLLIEADEFERTDMLTKAWVSQHPKSADVHYDRGLLLAHSTKLPKRKEAVKELDKALALEPRLNIAHYQLGLVLVKLDDKERAEKELSTFINNHPSDQEKVKRAQDTLERLKAK